MSNEQVLTLEEHLASFVDICDEYKQLYAAWTTGKRNLIKILSNVSLVFPHYSLHDDSHAQSILRNIERILGTERIKTLKPTEVWLLLMSAYSHDIGMLVKHKELCEVWSSPEFDEYLNDIMSNPKQSELKDYAKYFKDENFKMEMLSDFPVQLKWAVIILSADYFRKKHADMGYKIITDMDNYGLDFKIDFSFNKFIPERIIYLLGKIAKLHGKTFDDVKKLNFCTNGIGLSDDYVYPRRIAELIRLGDLLDLDNGRFNENTYKLFGDIPETTLANREKHKAIRHFLVCDNCIEVTADCPDENSYQAVRDWFDWLHDEIQNLSLHWHEIMPENFGAAPPLPKLKIFLHGVELKGNSLLKFDFKTEHIFELLEGANIYRNSYAFFRELIQNSIDSSKLHLWSLICNGTYNIEKNKNQYIPLDIPKEIFDLFKIRINIIYEKDQDRYKVEISDKGIGFSEDILNNMQNITQSWQNRKNWKSIIKNMPAWLRPTGGFGLGLQSVFKITDSMECITKSIDGIKRKIIFRSREKGSRISYKVINSLFSEPIETKISFFIDSKKIKIISYPFGGKYHEAVINFNPFEKKYDNSSAYLKLIYMLECITEDVYDCFFPIEIYFKVNDLDNKIYISRPSYDDIKDSECTICEKDYILNIDWHAGKIILYDALNCISLKMKFIERGYIGKRKVLFKGMAIDDYPLIRINKDIYDYIALTVELDGLETKEYLTLNREELRYEKLDKVTKLILNNLIYALSKLIEITSAMIDDKSDYSFQKYLLNICCIYEKFLKEIKNFPHEYKTCYSKLINNVDGVIKVYKNKNENEFVLKEIKIKEILKQYSDGRDFYIIIEDESSHIQNPILSDGEPYEALEKFSNVLKGIDQVFARNIYYFLSIRHIKSIYKTKTEENNSYFLLCCSNKYSDAIINEMDAMSKESLYEHLLDFPYMTTVAFEEYKSLAVNNIPSILNTLDKFSFPIRYNLSYQINQFKRFITPFNVDDIKNIKDINISIEDIWKNISERNDFKNLINYVQKNNISDNITEIDIKETYKKFIEDIINTFRK